MSKDGSNRKTKRWFIPSLQEQDLIATRMETMNAYRESHHRDGHITHRSQMGIVNVPSRAKTFHHIPFDDCCKSSPYDVHKGYNGSHDYSNQSCGREKGENEDQRSTKTFLMSIVQVQKAKGTSLEDLEDSTSNGEERWNPTIHSRVMAREEKIKQYLLPTIGSVEDEMAQDLPLMTTLKILNEERSILEVGRASGEIVFHLLEA
ncbi:hypothetical protein M9H77_26657 [Catharanthus roseus]|uniref:Uncharacterized protein n=1 Tax=Catharanthus roseus TaxID=4058 RepID=A0ACC0AAN3_CATRO|nr:hypothetical protein M9H77_26657 [Catharanthus roseus]